MIVGKIAKSGRENYKSRVVWHLPRTDPKTRRELLRSQGFTVRAHGIAYGKMYEPNGDRETARRRRQIGRGQLKAENGLVP